MRVVAVANQKGGVGKTTISYHLACFLAEKGIRVLAVDLDPQGNLSVLFGAEGNSVIKIFESEIIDAQKVRDNLFLVSSDISLAKLEAQVDFKVYKKLYRTLKKYNKDFDVVVVDCPPSLGVFTINAFLASQRVLVPVRPELLSIVGLRDLMELVAYAKEDWNPDLKISGLVVNAVQQRTRVAREVINGLSGNEGVPPIIAVFPQSVKVVEASMEKLPVWEYAGDQKVGEVFKREISKIAEEVLS